MPVIQATLAVSSNFIPIVPFVCGALFALLIFYRLFLHPLSHIPGPLLARVTSLHLYTICYLGIECRWVAHYHRKYNTSVLRIAPNAVSISDGAALHPIYVDRGGFQKDPRYENFRIDGHATIFSTLDTAYRDLRAKAVLPLFAMGRIRAASEDQGIMRQCVDKFIERVQSEKSGAQRHPSGTAKIDVLDLSQRLAIDVVSGYLFNKRYGGLDERAVLFGQGEDIRSVASTTSHMSAHPFIVSVVDFGAFSLLPSWLFTKISTLFAVIGRLFPNPEIKHSFKCVNEFSSTLANDANPEKHDTYQSRLLALGLSKSETAAQCKAVMFAGTDSTSVKLATIIFHLVQNPSVQESLRLEFGTLGANPATDLQTLPYLRAVIKEGLRVGMANPACFTRIVPPGDGFDVGGTHIAAGTTVGLAAYTLHHNPELFPEPFAFHPERWLDERKDTQGGQSDLLAEKRNRDRERDMVPFGVGSRMCIARNLAMQELFMAVRALVESRVLDGARTCKESIELEEFFNVGIKGHKLELEWSS